MEFLRLKFPLSHTWFGDHFCEQHIALPDRLGYLSTTVKNLKLRGIKIQRQRRCYSLRSMVDSIRFVVIGREKGNAFDK